MTNAVHNGNKKGGSKPPAVASSAADTSKNLTSQKSNKPFIILPQMNKPLKKTVVITTPSAPASNGTSVVAVVGGAVIKTADSATKTMPAVTTKIDKKVNSTKTTSSTVNTKVTAETNSSFQPPQFQKKKNEWWKLPKSSQQPVGQPSKQHTNNKTADSAANDGASFMLVSPETPWYDQFPNSFGKAMKTASTNSKPVDEKTIQEMQEAAKLAYQKEIDCYRQELAKLGISSDQKWLSSVINSGTWSDKIAALALRVQESPFHNLEAFDLLLGIALKKDMRSGFMAIEAIKDLLVNNLLPDNRSLRDFNSYSSALQVAEIANMQIPMLCWYEHQMKMKIAQMLTVIENGLKANITHFRHQAMDICLELVSKRQEQETRILSMLVNKMGDSEGKISSKACELLKNLLKRRPTVKSSVIREVRIFIYRPNTKLTAIFTAVNFLGQIHRSTTNSFQATKQDSVLALQLAECYLSLFEKAITAKEEGSRLLTALLNGINKVFPFLSDNDKNHSSLMPYMDQIFRLVHTANSFATSTQALALIAHMVFANNAENEKVKEKNDEENAEPTSSTTEEDEKSNSVRNRYYVTLYSKLLSTQSFQHAKNTLFLNLIYKSIKYDPNLHR